MYYLLLSEEVTTKLRQCYDECHNKFVAYRVKSDDNVTTKGYFSILIYRRISTTTYQVKKLLIVGRCDNLSSG